MNNYKDILPLLNEYRKTSLWKILSGEDFFKIEGFDDNIYVSILGNAGLDFGIVIFKGDKELFSQLDISYGDQKGR